MKALTISQPYASLIANGEKWVENRTWETKYRGPLAIHAGKGTQYLTRRELATYLSGCIIAVAELVACVNIARSRRFDRMTQNDYQIHLMRHIVKQYGDKEYAMTFQEIADELGISPQSVERHYLKGLYRVMIAMWCYVEEYDERIHRDGARPEPFAAVKYRRTL